MFNSSVDSKSILTRHYLGLMVASGLLQIKNKQVKFLIRNSD